MTTRPPFTATPPGALDLSGPVSRDRLARIQDGDTVLVPKGNAFFVFGEVRKPGAYQLDRATTILEGITMRLSFLIAPALAGGFTDKAAPGRTRVIRSTATGQQGITVDVNDIIKRGQGSKAMQLQENDVVVVPESFF